MPRCEVGKLHAPVVEKYILAEEDGVGPVANKSCESRIDLAAVAGVVNLDLQSDGAGSRFQVSQRGLCIRDIGWIDEHDHMSRSRHQLTQELQALCRQLIVDKIDPRQVAAWPGEAGDKPQPHRVLAE